MSDCTENILVQQIESSETIGNSLVKINSNFRNLDSAVCELKNSFEPIVGEGVLKVEGGDYALAIPNADFLYADSTVVGLLKLNENRTITAAQPTIDYCAPNTELKGTNVVASGNLTVAGKALINNIVTNNTIVDGTTNITGSLTVEGITKIVGNVLVEGVVRAQNFLTESDRNLKENIIPIENSLEKVSKLNGVNYQWKNNSTVDVGVIAQEVQEVLPEAVYKLDNDFLSVSYVKLIPLLIESIKELKLQIEELKAKS